MRGLTRIWMSTSRRTQLFAAVLLFLLAPAQALAGLIGPTPYLSQADSPFNPASFSYFYLEDFEDHLLNTPGVAPDPLFGCVTSVCFGPSIHDSVDGDDGVIDGSGLNGDSFFGAHHFEFIFDAAVLGSLPTSAGIVWTDGNNGDLVWFEALDANGNQLCYIDNQNIADFSNGGETAEDRFFGCQSSSGIKVLRIGNGGGGIEADHLQYGGGQPVSTPEPGTLALLGLSLAGLGFARRRRTH